MSIDRRELLKTALVASAAVALPPAARGGINFEPALAYNFGRDIALPGSSGPKLGFLMYPQAETAGTRLDCLDPENCRYTISAKEVSAA